MKFKALVPIACAAFLVALALVAAFAPLIVTQDPLELDLPVRLSAPSPQHWMGTDALGRDLFSRVVWGSRTSLGIALAVAILSSTVGALLGLAAASARWVEWPVMRAMDGLMAIPGILLALALTALGSPGAGIVVIAITVPEIPRVTRLAWSVAIGLKQRPFIDASRAAGTRTLPMIWHHFLPHMAAPLMVKATFTAGVAVLVEASLSFLGAGFPAESCSWGLVIAEGRSYLMTSPFIVAAPGALLAATVLSIHMVGDALQTALNPREPAMQ